MVSGFAICSSIACFVVVGFFVVPIWSDDMWSADIASGFAATSSAKATLVEATATKATKAAAPMKIFSLEVMECTSSGCGRRWNWAASWIEAVIAANGAQSRQRRDSPICKQKVDVGGSSLRRGEDRAGAGGLDENCSAQARIVRGELEALGLPVPAAQSNHFADDVFVRQKLAGIFAAP